MFKSKSKFYNNNNNKHLETKEKKTSTIYLALDNTLMRRTRINGNDIIAKYNRWFPIERDEVSIYHSKYKTTSPAIQRTQFPLILSWTCTVHKVQGVSWNAAVISFDLEKQKSFNQGQIYVPLGGVININKLYLIGKYVTAIQVNRDVASE